MHTTTHTNTQQQQQQAEKYNPIFMYGEIEEKQGERRKVEVKREKRKEDLCKCDLNYVATFLILFGLTENLLYMKYCIHY